MPNERLYVVDRIEGELVVLLDEETGEKVNLDSWQLPLVDEGMVLRVNHQGDRPNWGTVVIDQEATAHRRADAEKTLEDLRKRDPGGDLVI